jgi:hypothetical protein
MENRSETIKLRFPVQLADRLLEEVTIRRPTMGDIRKHPIKSDTDIDGEMRQLCALCDLRLEEMERVDSADYARLQGIYVRFRSTTE